MCPVVEHLGVSTDSGILQSSDTSTNSGHYPSSHPSARTEATHGAVWLSAGEIASGRWILAPSRVQVEAFIILTEKWNCMEPNGLDIPAALPKTSKVMVPYILGAVTSVKVLICCLLLISSNAIVEEGWI